MTRISATKYVQCMESDCRLQEFPAALFLYPLHAVWIGSDEKQAMRGYPEFFAGKGSQILCLPTWVHDSLCDNWSCHEPDSTLERAFPTYLPLEIFLGKKEGDSVELVSKEKQEKFIFTCRQLGSQYSANGSFHELMEEMFMKTYNSLQQKYCQGILTADEQAQWEIADAIRQKHYPNSSYPNNPCIATNEIQEKGDVSHRMQSLSIQDENSQFQKSHRDVPNYLEKFAHTIDNKMIKWTVLHFYEAVERELVKLAEEKYSLETAKVHFVIRNPNDNSVLCQNDLILNLELEEEYDGWDLSCSLGKAFDANPHVLNNYEHSTLLFNVDIFFKDKADKYIWLEYEYSNHRCLSIEASCTLPLTKANLVEHYKKCKQAFKREEITIFDAKGEFEKTNEPGWLGNGHCIIA